jgi:hypothetical protein
MGVRRTVFAGKMSGNKSELFVLFHQEKAVDCPNYEALFEAIPAPFTGCFI